MFQHMWAYCASAVGNVLTFLYHFLLSYKSYVLVNIMILGLNLILLRTVQYYISKKKSKQEDSLKINLATFGRTSHTRLARSPRSQISLNRIPSVKVLRQQSQNAVNRNPRSASTQPRTYKNNGKTALTFQKLVSPPTPVQSPHSGKRQTNVDKCDETLDEITWACDDTHSSLAKVNAKYCDSQVQTQSDEDIRESPNSHICRRMGKCTDVRDNRHKNGQGDTFVKEENQQKKERTRQESKKRHKDEDSQTKVKSSAQKKKTGKLKQRHKKVSRGVNTLKQSATRQQNKDSEEPEKTVSTDLRPDANKETPTNCEEKRPLMHETRSKRTRKKQHTSPRAIEAVKNSSGDSKNSFEESDPDMGGSDQQFHGNRSESSLVCKRDSWIWFSPDMRPSVEDFAARQRKFRSRDPRVAELAVEISRQEELNRDIERAAESLIDSSSPSTCKLHDCSLRTTGIPIAQKSRIGAMKNRTCRKSRVAPYSLPDVKKLPTSPVHVTYLAKGDHVICDDNDYNNRPSLGLELPSDLVTILPVTTSLEHQTVQAKDSMTQTLKHRISLQKHSNTKLKTLSHGAICAEPRAVSSASSEHSKHSLAEPIPFEEESLPHGITWYNSPASNVIRRTYTPSRYSPLYDNTTLVCSTQCSLCSLASSSLEHAKATSNPEKNRTMRMEVKDESNQRESCHAQNGKQSSPVELKRSPADINLNLGNYIRGDKMTSPKRRKYYKDVPESTVMVREEAESCPDSPTNVQERYKDRLSPKWRSSKHSPRKRRFSDRAASYSSRLTPETRMESSKHTRRSPQLTFSTGESESDSVYRDKSGGPDASYRQCVISKEVNTTVQRLLFDTEKSSSSHSPSSRSKIQFPDVNTDEDANRVTKNDIKCLPETSNLRQSCTRINISKDSPPSTHAETQRGKQDSDSDKNSCSSREVQMLQVMKTAPSFTSSDSQTYCSCRRAHKFTNIYARDYYLGKRVTMKKQLQASASVHSSKWKKLDLSCCPTAPCHSRYSPHKSRISSLRRDCGNSSRESFKRKSAVKLMAYASRHTHRFRSCAGCQFTQTFSETSADNVSKENLAAAAKDDNELYINRCKCRNLITRRHQQAPIYNKCIRAKVGFSDIIEKKLTFRKSSSQMDNCTPSDSLAVSPSKKAYVSSRSAVSVHRCKKEDGAQAETSKRLAVASTNNSSSNLSYGSDKSTSSEKPSSFSNTAQFYFVTGTKRSEGNSCHRSDGLRNFKHSKDALVDMFKNSQMSGLPMKSSMTLKQNMPVIQSGIKNEPANEVKESILTECTTDPDIPAYFTAATSDNHKTQAIADRSTGYSQQGKRLLAEHEIYSADKWDTKSLEAASNSMYYSKQNPDASTPFRHASIIEGDIPYKGRVSVLEDCASKSEALRPFETDTVDVDQCNLTTPVMASTVKQGSNPDSGYDESLSEKANGDCSFKRCMATAVDSSRTGLSPLWFKLHISNLDQPGTKSLSMSPQSDGSRDADHAHRSHISNDFDSEQDTLPSLSDDTFKSYSNFDMVHQSSETPREVENTNSVLSMKDRTRQGIDQHLSFHESKGYNAERVSSCKAAKETKADNHWACHHNIENETGITGSQQKLLPECNKQYLNESSNNAGSWMGGCHSGSIAFPPASPGHKHSDDWARMVATPEIAPEGSSYSADVSNTGSMAADHFVSQIPAIFHFKAKSFQTHILEKDAAEKLTQTNSIQTTSCGLNHAAELQEPEMSHSFYKSACHFNTLEFTRATNLAQSDKDIDNVWPTAAQNQRRPVTYFPMVNLQASKATSLTPKLKTRLPTHMPLDWPPLDETKVDETTVDLLGKEPQVDHSDNASISAGNSMVKTTLNSCRLTVPATEICEDALPQSITLPSSSDEEDAPEGVYSPGRHMRTSDFETSENSTGDFSNRRKNKEPFTENGTCGPQWSRQEDNTHCVLTSKLHQSKPKQQQSNTRFLNQAKSKVFISDRSIPFSEILKRF
ncbi:hypothetical protein BsWGS_21934 [Bradybaena similaris]